MLKKQYTPPAGAERMPRPHPYGGDMPEGPDPLLRDPEQHRREGAMSDLLHNLLRDRGIQTHGPLPPNKFIPFNIIFGISPKRATSTISMSIDESEYTISKFAFITNTVVVTFVIVIGFLIIVYVIQFIVFLMFLVYFPKMFVLFSLVLLVSVFSLCP